MNIGNAQALKKESVIEAELNILRNRVSAARKLSSEITDILWNPEPANESAKSQVLETLADHLSNISADIQAVNERLQGIYECLHGQLGDLKLKN